MDHQNRVGLTAPSSDSSTRLATTEFVANAVATAVSSLPSAPGAGGRLTLVSQTPIMSATVSSATTVFFTPYHSQIVPLFDGTSIVMTDTGGELSQATTDTTKSPAAVVANSNYDVFVWNDAGTIRATRGNAWSSQTVRGTGNNIFQQNGVYLNASSITNGPAAARGTYVGTIASNSSSSIDWIFGGSASGGSAGRFCVWNNYNRGLVSSFVFDTGVSYTYTTNAVRQARASTGNQIQFLVGVTEDSFTAWAQSFIQPVAVAGAAVIMGLGVDSTTVFTAAGYVSSPSSSVSWRGVGSCWWSAFPGLGLHTVTRLEDGDGANANTIAYFGGDQLGFNFPM